MITRVLPFADTKQSDMYKAMARRPQQSRQSTEKPAEQKPRLTEDEMALQRLNEKRRARGEQEVRRGQKIPDWAAQQISEAKGREGSSRPLSHSSSHK